MPTEISTLAARLSEGNMGCLTICLALGNRYGLRPLQALERTELRGSAIWQTYKEKCFQDLEKFNEWLMA